MSAPDRKAESGVLAHERVLASKASAAAKIDPQTQRDVLLLFHKLKQKQTGDVALGNKFVGVVDYAALRTMDYKGLRELLPGTDEATLKFIFRFFDDNLDGRINTAEFLMAVAMLSQPCDSAEEQIDACFRMFDSDGSGSLSREEFTAMIHASVALDLGSLLLTPEGEERMEVACEREYALETINFWREAVAFRSHAEGDEGQLRAVNARYIYDRYVREGAPEEINLPSKQRAQIEASLAAAAAKGRPPEANAFLRAEHEMFALMERNAFARLRGDSAMLEELASAFFNRADADGDGVIRFDEYRTWASEQPQVLAFFGQLRNTIRRLVSSHAVVARASTRERVDEEAPPGSA